MAAPDPLRWRPAAPKVRPVRVVVSWLVSALALLIAAWIVPHVAIPSFWGGLLTAAIVALVNAVIPPVVAALRLPFTALLGFVLVLFADAAALLIASESMTPRSRWIPSDGRCWPR